MLRNVHTQNDIVYVMQPTRNLMLAVGVWAPRSGRMSVFQKIYNLFLNFSTNFLLACEFIPGSIYWLLEESARMRLQMCPLLFYVFMSVIQYYILLSRNGRIRQCWKHVEEDWENVFSMDARNVMFKGAKSAKFLILICAALMYTGSIMFRIILPLSQGKIVTDQNITIRPLACPVNFLFIDAQASPFYEILFVFQAITGFIIVSVATSAYGLLAYFVEHASGQMKIQIWLMKCLVQEQRKKEHEIDKKLAEVVEHQIRVRSFLQMVQYTMQEICLIEIMESTLTICVLLYFIILDWDSHNFGVIGSYALNIVNVTIHIFLFCYTGEQLNDQAEKVAIESRELEWYNLPEKKMRSIVLLMIMSNYPPKISAGKIMVLSLKTFGDVIKTSGAYFNMLRNVIE
ncbi:odorant receptor 4-like isoform X2 [Harpegnathos saltator]|uniref:odorant receptor 4-like isoform X2 n=1 Tax=Harpegnathos saltator TaxID=610380 RepID=UPI000DBEF02F|nr:odorant receptor 4-like isoform X2 [Harpegnathos saltator]